MGVPGLLEGVLVDATAEELTARCRGWLGNTLPRCVVGTVSGSFRLFFGLPVRLRL